MTHLFPAGPVRRKVERADHHRVQLVEILEDFRDRDPYEVLIEDHELSGVPHRFWTAQNPEEPSSDVPLILGDFIQNLRASLDYLVGEMLPSGPTDKSSFPITNKGRQAFKEASRRHLADVPKAAVKIIEKMQPYHRGRPSKERLLWRNLEILELLWNIDKHRSILLTVTILSPKYAFSNRTEEEDRGIGWGMSRAENKAQWAIRLGGSDDTFHPHFGIEVSLAKPRGFTKDWIPWIERWALDSLVTSLYNTVQYGVLPQFREFVKASD